MAKHPQLPSSLGLLLFICCGFFVRELSAASSSYTYPNCPYLVFCSLLTTTSLANDITISSPTTPVSQVFETGAFSGNNNKIVMTASIDTKIANGDFVLLYLAQDGNFDSTDSSTFGQPTGPNNAGVWQINKVINRSGTLVEFECDLNPAFNSIQAVNSYHRMVITKFMAADTLTITSGSSVTASKFTSSTSTGNKGGGVVAILANKIVMASGTTISADGSGFSGGQKQQYQSGCSSCVLGCHDTEFKCSYPSSLGATRGASIAPYSEDVAVRGQCRGAQANGGGGGNNHNAPGGGGANVCSNSPSLPWTGNGLPDRLYDKCWLLENANKVPDSTGGGRGGYSWSTAAGDPTKRRPNSCLNWGGNGRLSNGGLGGRPLTTNQNNLYFGGGGGAGHENNGNGGSGGNGGGLVFIIAGQLTISGTTPATISSNGNDGESSTAADFNLNDAPGGGGAGGTVFLYVASSSITPNVAISATGGTGGNNQVKAGVTEREGGGGGGGGGAVYTDIAVTATVVAGTYGISGMTLFPPNGATSGCSGIQKLISCPSPSSSSIPSNSATRSSSPIPSKSATPSSSPVPSKSATSSSSPIPSKSATPSSSPVPSKSATPSLSPIPSKSATPSASPPRTPSPSKLASVTPSISFTASKTLFATTTASSSALPSLTQSTSYLTSPTISSSILGTNSPSTSETAETSVTPALSNSATETPPNSKSHLIPPSNLTSSSPTISSTNSQQPSFLPSTSITSANTETKTPTSTPSVVAAVSSTKTSPSSASTVRNIGGLIELSCAGIQCDDNDPCTVEVCLDGQCLHEPVTCDDSDICTTDRCSNGQCLHQAIRECFSRDCRSISDCGECQTTPECSWLLCANSQMDLSNITTVIINNRTDLYSFYSFKRIPELNDVVPIRFRFGNMSVFFIDQVSFLALGNRNFFGECVPDTAIEVISSQYESDSVTCQATNDCRQPEANQLNAQISSISTSVAVSGASSIGCFIGSCLITLVFYRRKKRPSFSKLKPGLMGMQSEESLLYKDTNTVNVLYKDTLSSDI